MFQHRGIKRITGTSIQTECITIKICRFFRCSVLLIHHQANQQRRRNTDVLIGNLDLIISVFQHRNLITSVQIDRSRTATLNPKCTFRIVIPPGNRITQLSGTSIERCHIGSIGNKLRRITPAHTPIGKTIRLCIYGVRTVQQFPISLHILSLYIGERVLVHINRLEMIQTIVDICPHIRIHAGDIEILESNRVDLITELVPRNIRIRPGIQTAGFIPAVEILSGKCQNISVYLPAVRRISGEVSANYTGIYPILLCHLIEHKRSCMYRNRHNCRCQHCAGSKHAGKFQKVLTHMNPPL